MMTKRDGEAIHLEEFERDHKVDFTIGKLQYHLFEILEYLIHPYGKLR
jgi:hypothetical protein